MKVITKYKDYYDYLVGEYGIDPIMVYDRRPEKLKKWEMEYSNLNGWTYPTLHKFSICGNYFALYSYKNNFYHTISELVKLSKILEKDGEDQLWNRWGFNNKPIKGAKNHFEKHNGKSNLNYYFREPILVNDTYGELKFKNGSYSVPLLKTYPYFPSNYPAKQIWQEVYAFISYLKDHPEIPNKLTDLEKLNSYGFDEKKSFRHRK